MKKLISLSFLLSLSFLSFSQNKTDSLHREAISWYKNIERRAYILKNAKEKTVEFNKYEIHGYFSKKKLSKGSIVNLYDTAKNCILSGTCDYLDEQLKVKGIKTTRNNSGKITNKIYGTFRVSNSPSGGMTYNPKKADSLNIGIHSVNYYYGQYENSSAIVKQKHKYSTIAIKNVMTNYGRGELYCTSFPTDKLNHIGYSNITGLLLSTGNHFLRIFLRNGDTFSGYAIPKLDSYNRICVYLLEGDMTFHSVESPADKISVRNDGRFSVMTLNGKHSDSTIKNETLYAYSYKIQKDSIRIPDAYYKNLHSVKQEYHNGDVYQGAAYVSNVAGKYQIHPTNGTYTFANGDSFTGDLSKGTYCGIPIAGKYTFNDKTTANGIEWLTILNLPEKEADRLSKLRFPSAIRDSALKWQEELLFRQKEQEFIQYLSAADSAEFEGKWKDAEEYYRQALKIKPDKTELEEDIRRVRLIDKYGYANGLNMINGEIKLGMTKQMVLDMLPEDIVKSYKVSREIWLDDEYETWKYEYDHSAALIGALFGDYGLGYALGYEERRAAMTRYKYIRFKNNKVVELKE